jgi:hypothetical protein
MRRRGADCSVVATKPAVVAGTGIILLAQEQKFQLLTRRLRSNHRPILPHSTRRTVPGARSAGLVVPSNFTGAVPRRRADAGQISCDERRSVSSKI